MKKYLFLFSLFLIFFGLAGEVRAEISKVEGYAWSSNVGWISFNCSNSNNCGNSNYGVSLDRDTDNLSGYAWNSGVGWISFNPADVAGCPSTPCAPKVVDGVLIGWAKVLSGSPAQGWEGWMHLSGANYGVDFDGTEFTGFSWSDEVLGWVKWNPVLGPGVFSEGNVTVETGVDQTGSSVEVGSNTCESGSCVYEFEYGETVDLIAEAGVGYVFENWFGADALECGNTQSRFCYNIDLYDDKQIKAHFVAATCPSDGPGSCPVCNDGFDNDNDGDTDYPEDTDCSGAQGESELSAATPQCNDCLDNDGDGQIDWVNDSGCADNPEDDNELNAQLEVSIDLEEEGAEGMVVSDPEAIECEPNCSEVFAEDESIKLTALPVSDETVFVKWEGACSGFTPVCNLVMNLNRTVTAVFTAAPLADCPDAGPEGGCPACIDGVDNDDDGYVDYPEDPGCEDYDDEDEFDETACPSADPELGCPQCIDGIDNDGDDFIDFPDDPECYDYEDDDESDFGPDCPAAGPEGGCPQCYDGVDNDDDGYVDYPEDPGCFNRADDSEIDPQIIGNCPEDGPGVCPQCNDGIDNDGDGKTDWQGWDADADGVFEIPRDLSCQGEPNKNSEAGGLDIIEI